MGQMNYSISEKIIELQPRIWSAACRVFSSQPIPGLVEMEDIQQNMNLRILERAAQIPNLPEQTNAYIMNDAARNGGIRSCIKATIYMTYVQPEDILQTDNQDDEECEKTVWEFYPASELTPEKEIENRETINLIQYRAMKLSEEIQEVLILSLNGYSDSEIAKKLGVSRSAICQRRRRLIAAFSDL